MTVDSRRRAVWLCFFLSGAAGLIYEVVWARQLSLFLGITAFAHTAVVTAYMAGLAAGSLYFGRRADRSSDPLILYARLEIAICVYALMTPFLFDWLQVGYAQLAGVAGISGMAGHLGRFAIALGALLVPTFLMGGTLPLLVRGFVRELPQLGGITARLYGLNTLGAVLGTLAAGYWLLPQFGILVATLAGVLINLGIAVWILSSFKRGAALPAGEPGVPAAPPGKLVEALPPAHRLAMLVAFGMAGFASLLTQMAWIRAMILVVGGSVYAFTITLASFLAGIGLGSILYARWLGSLKDNRARLGRAAVICMLIALSMLAGLPIIQKLPHWFLGGFAVIGSDRFALFQVFVLVLSFGVMIVPTLLMGALFPLIAVSWTRSNERAAEGIGTAYAINAVGTILGALLGGLVILPAAGIHNSIQLAATVYVLAALMFWWPGSHGLPVVRRSLAALVGVPAYWLVLILIPPWDRMLMASGPYYRADVTLQLIGDRSLEAHLSEAQLLYYDEGLDGTVTVKLQDNERSLAVNGKIDASSSGDLPTQVLLGQLPLQMDRQIRNAMVIGLGSGITAGSVATRREIENLTILEISGEVVEASDFFLPENYGVLADPRVELVTADARNYLLATRQRFDLIVSEPSNPWISGISNLFTEEFFDLVQSRLTEGGLLTQWFHTYNMSLDDFRSVLGAISGRFGHVSVFRTLPGDLVIVASAQPFGLNLGTVDWADPENIVTREFQRAHVFADRDLVRLYLIGDEALRQFTAGAPRNSDRHPQVEFNAPRNLYADTDLENMDALYRFLGGKDLQVPVRRLLELRNDGIVARPFGVRIDRVDDIPMQLQSAQWPIAHSQFPDGSWGTGSQRRLIWREREEGIYLQADWQAERPDFDQLQGLLRSLVVGEVQFTGEIDIEGSRDPAVWTLHLEPETRRLRLGLAWSCVTAEGIVPGFTRYAAATSIPAEWHANQEYILDTFAGRFECLHM